VLHYIKKAQRLNRSTATKQGGVTTIEFEMDPIRQPGYSQYGWISICPGAKILINGHSVRIQQTCPKGKAQDWMWTRETYRRRIRTTIPGAV